MKDTKLDFPLGEITHLSISEAAAETRIVRDDAWERDNALKEGWIPIATWLDPGKITLHETDGDHRTKRTQEVIAPVRHWLLSRSSVAVDSALRAEAKKLSADLTAARTEAYNEKKRADDMTKKAAADHNDAVEVRELRKRFAKLESHMAAVKVAIGSERYEAICKKHDDEEIPF